MTTETLPASAGKQTVVLLHGGRSSEHEISCVTTAGIFSAIDRERFDVVLVGITKAGQTVLLGEGDLAGYALDAAELPQVRDNGTRVLWPLSPGDRNLTVIGPDGRVQPVAEIDVVFPVLHGPFGEDGTVQGMLELVDVPYVGAGVLASSLCMDKHFTKLVLAESGIRVAPGRTIRRGQLERNPELLAQADAGLSYPLFVKPLRAGSSVGVSRVAEAAEIPAALDLAFESDDAVLIESGVVGREVEIAVLGGRAGQSPRASAVAGEIVMNGDGFYDYEAKYL
ncbi:D-alanine--D-alanine ligase family protein, partial [Leucobacter sp. M11]|uniref:D-alanine--D-alanine ligase family protein n=1 Tax=Leucobacter sp. M11 TaxID=2993565 RepID=UPI002D7E2DD6